MGIVSNAKQYIARTATAMANGVADGISKASGLSQQQIQQIEKRKTDYFACIENPSDEQAQEYISRNLGAVAVEVHQAYLQQLHSLYEPVDTALDQYDDLSRIRYFDITKWVYDDEENNLDKLVNVYHVLCEEDCNIALIYHRTTKGTSISLGVVNTDADRADPSIANALIQRLAGALKGNFPGAEVISSRKDSSSFGAGIPTSLCCTTGSNSKSVAIVSNLASEKSLDFVSQGMEKLLDGIVPNDVDSEYSLVLLAKPLRDILVQKNRVYELYSMLSPYATWQRNTAASLSDSQGSSAIGGVSLGIGGGISSGSSLSGNANIGVAGATATASKGASLSGNFGLQFSRASTTSIQVGKTESITQTYTNYGVKHTLDIIEEQRKRIDSTAALGSWEFAAYVVSSNPVIANNVAHMYLALTQGDESHLSQATVALWDGENAIESDAARNIINNIQRLQHPVLGLKPDAEDEWLMYPTLITPSTTLTGKELARALNFPQHSVSGLPVVASVAFGRDVSRYEDTNPEEVISLGKIYHMHQAEQSSVDLALKDFTMHTFITGSTGTGKSNTVYTLLEEFTRNKIPYLVIEPAKGEYKDVFGKPHGTATVYGTNPKEHLLRINPFSFPSDHVHIYEHLDRLIEIFNVCWPMYAAMPAVLKEATERAYVSVGWDLKHNINKYSKDLFPSFIDVLHQIDLVMEESQYSTDSKGDYKGALSTRLKSMTNGINGLIFCANELTNEEIFGQNVIVDLSRVGSTETKALIMGILIMKLQEYRSYNKSQNGNLHHITVLEEAHNLLRKTSSEQTAESANVAGKSVEMIANAIAEMRSAGEGFIIADQSPGLLDISVIRNTNTKIILRLPEATDRALVGGAAALTEKQITELSRLPKGKAAVYQNNWVEAVLCEIPDFSKAERITASVDTSDIYATVPEDQVISTEMLLDSIRSNTLPSKSKLLEKNIITADIPAKVKCYLLDYVRNDTIDYSDLVAAIAYDLLNAEAVMRAADHIASPADWLYYVKHSLTPSICDFSKDEIDFITTLVVLRDIQIHPEHEKEVYLKFNEGRIL